MSQGDSEAQADKRLSLRMSAQDMEQLEQLRAQLEERINRRAGTTAIRVSQKMLVMEAFDALTLRWKEAERKAGKKGADHD